MWSTARAWNIVDAAKHVGLEIDGFEREGKGYRFRVKLGRKRLGDSADIEAGQRATDRRYQRVSGDGSIAQWRSAERRARRVAAVCWHGYRDFIRTLYALQSDCVVRTALCVYRGQDHFEATYLDTRDGYVAGQEYMFTTSMDCVCGDEE